MFSLENDIAIITSNEYDEKVPGTIESSPGRDTSHITSETDNQEYSIQAEKIFTPDTPSFTPYGSTVHRGVLMSRGLESHYDPDNTFTMSATRLQEEEVFFKATANEVGLPADRELWRSVVVPQFEEIIQQKNAELLRGLVSNRTEALAGISDQSSTTVFSVDKARASSDRAAD